MRVGPEGSPMQRQLPEAEDQATVAIARIGTGLRHRWLAVYLMVIVGSVCGYLLSLGPFLMMSRNRSLPPEVEATAQVFFAPLVWAIMQFPIVENFYKRYFELIGVDL